MKMRNIIVIILLMQAGVLYAQKFITHGSIEFEVKTNVHRMMKALLEDEESSFWESIVASQPQFNVTYYKYEFNDNKGVFRFDRSADKRNAGMMFLGRVSEDDYWYNDYTNNKFINLKSIDDNYIISGDLPNIQWRIYPNDQTNIAGFQCRRASTILFDSVYVFAFYTDEIKISGGPMGLHGLPGMILGVTIPRLYTSWVATSVTLSTPDIKPPTKGKQKSYDEMMKILTDISKSRAREWKNAERWLHPMIWRTFL